MQNFPSTRTQEIKARHGVSSMCIGCVFNKEESWSDVVMDDKGRVCKKLNFDGIERLVPIFPYENHVCKNPDSPKHGNCIIGDLGCDGGKYHGN